MKEEELFICHAIQSPYSGFDIGKKYKAIPFSKEESYMYLINNTHKVMRFKVTEVNDYFLTIKQWREIQLNKLLSKL